MKYLYTIAVFLYGFGIRLASPFNGKAKLWLEGRKNLFPRLKAAFSANDKIAWFHAASLGEFEQGRPLIEAFKTEFPEYKILLTFFSPSGYEIRKNYPHADYICYLPLDTQKNAHCFLEIVKPEFAFFIKYEFWFHFLKELENRKTKTFLISGIFRPSQHFFKPWGKWFRKNLQAFTHFFVQNESSQKLLQSIGYKNATIAGDTRFDRVLSIAAQAKEIPLIEQFKGAKKLLIVGSSWPEDEKIIQQFLDSEKNFCKVILAPHEIVPSHLLQIKSLFGEKMIFYSEATQENINQFQVLMIDSIGMLSSLYKYGDIAFIGGGFGKGIHNILEAATFGLPVCFGPNFKKFQEAKDLIAQGGAFPICNKEEFRNIVVNLFASSEKLQQTQNICTKFVKGNAGATRIVINFLKQLQ